MNSDKEYVQFLKDFLEYYIRGNTVYLCWALDDYNKKPQQTLRLRAYIKLHLGMYPTLSMYLSSAVIGTGRFASKSGRVQFIQNLIDCLENQ